MRRYAAQRVGYGAVTMWLVTLCVFALLRVSGDPIKYMLPPEASFSDIERMRRVHGLDKPLWQQYLLFNKGIVTGEFGVSLRWDQRPAFEVFLSRLPATLQLATAAVVFLFPLWGILRPTAYTLVNLLPFTALGWLALGVIAAAVLRARRPATFKTLGTVFMPEER